MPPKPAPPPVPPVKLAPKEVSLQKPEELKQVSNLADPEAHPGLPAIRVMPKTPAEVQVQERSMNVAPAAPGAK